MRDGLRVGGRAGCARGEGTAMAAPKFRNDDEAAQYYLSTLREGTRADKIVARDGLAAIFSRRGLFEEAAELYELNIRAGIRTPELFECLSDVYRELGDDESANAALSEAGQLRAAAPPGRAATVADPPTQTATSGVFPFAGGRAAVAPAITRQMRRDSLGDLAAQSGQAAVSDAPS